MMMILLLELSLFFCCRFVCHSCSFNRRCGFVIVVVDFVVVIIFVFVVAVVIAVVL
jgi:hypothetical protein